MSVALVTIAAESAKPYINEWLEYNEKLGFAKIYLYDSSAKNIYNSLSAKNIFVVHLPVVPPQQISYEHFLSAYKHNYRFTFFCDTDEFLVLKKHPSINEFCIEYFNDSTTGAIAVNWKIFGNNGYVYKQKGSVLKNYTKCNRLLNKHIKCIVRNSAVLSMKGVHYPTLKGGYHLKNIKGNILPTPTYYNRNNLNDEKIVQLNHYYTRSAEEFVEKCNEIHVLAGAKKKLSFFEHLHTLYANEIDDLYAVNFLSISNSVLSKKKIVLIDIDKSYNTFLKHTFENDIHLPVDIEVKKELEYNSDTFYLIPLRNPIDRFVELFYRTMYDRLIILSDLGEESIFGNFYKEFQTVKQFVMAIATNNTNQSTIIHKMLTHSKSPFYYTLFRSIPLNQIQFLNTNNCHIFCDKDIKKSYLDFCEKTNVCYNTNLLPKLDMFNVFRNADSYEHLNQSDIEALTQFLIKDLLIYKKLSSL